MDPAIVEKNMFGTALDAFLAAPVAAVFAFVFGALWGSFFNVCIARIPLGQSVVRPGSHCFSCRAPVRPWHNVPILSYLLLRGRCRQCGATFSPRYLLVELLTASLSLVLYWIFIRQSVDPTGVRVARYAVYFAFIGVLIVLAFIDLDTKRLPDVITLPAIPVFFLAGFAVHGASWSDRAWGAAGGYLAVRLISDGYYYLRGREGLGLGDAKLLAVMGALLGWQALPPVIFAASFLGIVVAVPALVIARRNTPIASVRTDTEPEVPETLVPPAEDEPGQQSVRFTQIPFGPFLAASAVTYLLAADAVWPWLQDFLGLLGPWGRS